MEGVWKGRWDNVMPFSISVQWFSDTDVIKRKDMHVNYWQNKKSFKKDEYITTYFTKAVVRLQKTCNILHKSIFEYSEWTSLVSMKWQIWLEYWINLFLTQSIMWLLYTINMAVDIGNKLFFGNQTVAGSHWLSYSFFVYIYIYIYIYIHIYINKKTMEVNIYIYI